MSAKPDEYPRPSVVTTLRRQAGGYQYNVDYRVRDAVARVGQRAPESWWERAAAVVDADGHDTANPLGGGVDWFMQEDPCWLFPPEMRDQVAADAAEAAREVILEAMARLTAVMRPVAVALACTNGNAP